MALKKKKVLKTDEIELLDDNNEKIEKEKNEKQKKKEKKDKTSLTSTIILVISIILLLLSIGTYVYIYNKNQELENEINSSKENVTKVEEAIKNDQKAITEKEDEYEKLKEKVKDNLEELNIWEALKEELNKSLS